MKVVILDHIFPGIETEKKEFSRFPDLELIDAGCKTKEDVIAAAKGADAVLNQYNYLTEEVINTFDNCKVISTYGIGLDKIDIDAATKKGIFVCNSPDYNKEEVANHTVALICALSRRLFEFDRRVRSGLYATPFDTMKPKRMSESVMGFVGFGRIAKQIAARLKAFDMKFIAYDPFLTADQIAAAGATKVELADVMKESDYISCNVSLSKETFHLVSAEYLHMMKPTAFIVNCARGGILDEPALIEMLQKNEIAGAAIDTSEAEPLPADHPLCKLDNVILTPHAAWYTEPSMTELVYGTAHQAALVLAGEFPNHCVNYDAVMKVKNQK